MRTKPCIIVGVFFAFFLSLSSQSSVQAQQEMDDPNWRERQLEGLKKEFEKQNKKLEELEKKLEKLRPRSRFLDIYDYGPRPIQFLQIYDHGPNPIFDSRFLDRYDYGPNPLKRALTEVKHYHPLMRPDG